MSTKIGDESNDPVQLVANASAVIASVEKKPPQGEKNLRNAIIKFSMGKALKAITLGK